MNGIAEGVRQMRGTSVNQVDGVEHVLVTAGTGVPTSGLILGRNRRLSAWRQVLRTPRTRPSTGRSSRWSGGKLLRGAFPLIAIGIGIGGLYPYLGTIGARLLGGLRNGIQRRCVGVDRLRREVAGDPPARRPDHPALPAAVPGVGAGPGWSDHPALHNSLIGSALPGRLARVTSPRILLRYGRC